MFYLGVLVAMFSFIATTNAASLNCSPINGAAIYGQTWNGGYTFIGGVFNRYDSESIANRYGKGSKYDSNSIFDIYGDFGSKYSDYSALNKYASHPPIMYDSNYNFLGFLSIAGYKNDINPIYAYICATKSYISNWTNN